MAYFKINNKDFSMYVNSLAIGNKANYTAQTNAAGNSVVDYINNKRTFKVGIIPLNDTAMSELLAEVRKFNVAISFRNPETNALEEGIDCIIPTDEINYYTIQSGKVMYKAFTLQFTEL